MKVRKMGDETYLVRVEELLPCRRFRCIHEHMACATVILCPDGTYDTNRYVGICDNVDCMDCWRYFDGKCSFGRKHPHWNYSRRQRWGRPRW